MSTYWTEEMIQMRNATIQNHAWKASSEWFLKAEAVNEDQKRKYPELDHSASVIAVEKAKQELADIITKHFGGTP